MFACHVQFSVVMLTMQVNLEIKFMLWIQQGYNLFQKTVIDWIMKPYIGLNKKLEIFQLAFGTSSLKIQLAQGKSVCSFNDLV